MRQAQNGASILTYTHRTFGESNSTIHSLLAVPLSPAPLPYTHCYCYRRCSFINSPLRYIFKVLICCLHNNEGFCVKGQCCMTRAQCDQLMAVKAPEITQNRCLNGSHSLSVQICIHKHCTALGFRVYL